MPERSREVVAAMSDDEYANWLRDMYQHPWTAVENMSDPEHYRLVLELYDAVRSEDCLQTAPLGASVVLGPNPEDEIHYGPWRPADCARVFRRWRDEGLLYLFRFAAADEQLRLPPGEEDELLRHPETWHRLPGANEAIHLGITDAGVELPESEWLSLVDRDSL